MTTGLGLETVTRLVAVAIRRRSVAWAPLSTRPDDARRVSAVSTPPGKVDHGEPADGART
jgi:hypothetical protein